MQSALLSSAPGPFNQPSAVAPHRSYHSSGINTYIHNKHPPSAPTSAAALSNEGYGHPQNELPMSTSYHGSDAYYSNSDIQILHEIVKTAQSLLETLPESESIPTSVLFRAYDDILPRHGIDPDDDQHFSRVLFRIGGERSNGPLIKKFETVLDRMGIQIIFDDVTGAVTTEYPLMPRRHSLATVPEEQTHQILAEAEESSYENPTQQTNASPPPPPEISHSSPDITEPRLEKIFTNDTSRPVPKTAAWLEEARRQMRELGIDDETEAPTRDHLTTNEIAVSARQRETAPSPETMQVEDVQPEPAVEEEESEEDSDQDYEEDGEDEVYEPTKPMNLANVSRSRPPPASTISSAHPPIASGALGSSPPRTPPDNSTLTRAPVFEHIAANIVPNPSSPTQTTQPSQVLKRIEVDFGEMEARSKLAQEFLTSAHATLIFRWWRDRSKMHPATEEYHEAVAMMAQRRCTIQMTMMQWKDHAEFLRKQRIEEEKAAQKQREYMKIERIATRAGQIYSLTNNFAIWLTHATEEKERIGVARRHILRRRHFDQWKNLALSYNILSQRFIQTINFNRWAEAAATLARNDHKADILCSSRVAKMTLREWKREGYELLAERTRDYMIHCRFTNEWVVATDSSIAVEGRLERKCQMTIAQKTFATWSRWAEDKHTQWIEGTNASACNQASELFAVWYQCDAEEDLWPIYDIDLVEHTLRDWNLEAKARWMRGRSDQKLLNTAFRDWLLLQRMREFQRQRDESLRAQALSDWLGHSEALRDMEEDDNIIQASREASTLRLSYCIQRWAATANKLTRVEFRIERNEATCSANDCLVLWQESSKRQPEMSRWSSRGEFYLTANRCLVPWITKSREIRKRRLAAAFTQGRALQKERLVQRCWNFWEVAAQRGDHQSHGSDVAKRKRDRHMVASSFNDWMSSCANITALDESIESDSSDRQIASMISLWLDQAEIKATTDSTAWALWAHQIANEAWEHWGVAVETVEFKDANASRREKKRELRIRDQVFSLWMDSANETMSPSLPAPEEPPVWARTPAVRTPTAQSVQAVNFNNLAQLSTRSQPALHAASSRPLSDFNDIMANTPSRRTGLARSVVALSSTTPSMTLSTPKERELRAAYDGSRSQREQRLTPALVSFSKSLGPATLTLPSAQRPLRLALFQTRMASRPLDDLDEEPTMHDDDEL